MKLAFLKSTMIGTMANNGAGNVNSLVADLRDFDEIGHLLITTHNAAKDASRSLNFTVQQSATGTGNWVGVPGVAIDEVGNVDRQHSKVALRISELRRYLRVRSTAAGAGSDFVTSAVIVGVGTS